MENKQEINQPIDKNKFIRPKGICVQCDKRKEVNYYMSIILCDECWDEQGLSREDGGDEYS
jgi:hypothetical protein